MMIEMDDIYYITTYRSIIVVFKLKPGKTYLNKRGENVDSHATSLQTWNHSG
jgi:hypothetical protein